MRKPFVLLTIAVCVPCSSYCAIVWKDAWQDRAGNSFPGREEAIGKPLGQLPPQVESTGGELTLFADFENQSAGRVPVYVINRTNRPVNFYAQNTDIFLKLEYEAQPGRWVRAQPHVFSRCGNSYFNSPKLDPATYAVVDGHVPAKGTAARVRYTIYHQTFKASSNHGTGMVDEAAIDLAANDALNVDAGDFDFVRRVALGEIRLNNHLDRRDDLRRSAIGRLETDFHSADARRVLAQIARGNDPYAEMAQDALDRLRKSRWFWPF